ncbi:MAG TPA: hypothetical protein VMZ26_16020 [Pyrinomonadaceae bacterium]|nr:hypothetical protein [Pyrinomonadaceae bacterium]
MTSKQLLYLTLLLILTTLLQSSTHAQAKPDLIVTSASVTEQKRGNQVYQLTVMFTVSNYCKGTSAIQTGGSVILKPDIQPGQEYASNGYSTYAVIPALKGGEIQTVTIKINKDDGGYLQSAGDMFFKWLNQTGKLPTVRINVDLPNLVKEASETNNWWQLNPEKTPSKFSGQYQCTPKM